ncbi:MAG: PAS domain S-box protein [Pseudomonadota bacterium]
MKEHILAGQSLDWLLVSAADAMLVADAEGYIVLLNSALEKLFAYSREELLGQRLDMLLPERDRSAQIAKHKTYFEHPYARALGSGMELLCRRRDGKEFPVEVSLSPLQTTQGIALVMATLHDITPRKQAKQALLESEDRMRAIVDTALDAIVTIDERGTIERFNPAAERIFGYSQVEIAGKNVTFLMPSPDREKHDGYLARYLRTGEKKVIGSGREVVGQRKDGTLFPMDLSVAEMRVGERRVFTGMIRDISERKQAEERHARLMQEISNINEELSSFAYVVSHDLKAPLRAIASLADWLSTDYADKFDDEGREHMRLLTGRVRRMAGLIDGILQYSRVGRVKEVPVLVDLNQVVGEVTDLLAPPDHIKVTIDNSLPTVLAERTRMQQVFQNLVSNAVKYMDKPQGAIHIACTPSGDQWQFSVSDNGPGIEERHFERIFQLFQTLAPRDRVESTGVGLAVVKKILEIEGGRIWVESKIGAGSRFLFTLPKHRENASAKKREEHEISK